MAITIPTGSSNVTSSAVNSGTSITLNTPTNIANGDILFVGLWARANTTPFTTIPSGFTAIAPSGTEITSVGVFRGYWKLITNSTSEPSTYTWSGGSTGRNTGILFRILGGDSNSFVDAVGSEVSSVSGSPETLTLPGVTTTRSGDLLIALTGAAVSSGGTRGPFVPPGSMTQLTTVGTTTGASESDFSIATEIFSSAAATGTRLFTRTAATSSGLGYLLSVKSAVVATPLSLTGVMSPSSADTGVLRTLTLTASGGNGNVINLDVDWGDGLTHDISTMSSGVDKVFTRTPSTSGSKTAVISYSQSN